MNPILLVCMVVVIVGGFFAGLQDVANVKKYPNRQSVKESNNLFSFLFFDKY